MRPWFTADFHGGNYDFGSSDPISCFCKTIASLLELAVSEGDIKEQSSILLCPDARTDKYFSSFEIQNSLRREIGLSVLNLYDLVPSKKGFAYITLDYLLPAVMEGVSSTLISFDSNTTVPFYMAGLNFTSIHGAPKTTLESLGASEESIDYISRNSNRVAGYAPPDLYTAKSYDSSCIIVAPK
jgi:hypothetical protein